MAQHIDREEGQPLGRCPDCERLIPAGSPVVRYDPDDGWPRMVAQCPDCEDAVRPV